MVDKIIYRPIGIIHSPHKELKGTPIQPAAAENVDGSVELFPKYTAGLKDLEGFSHIILIYHFHLSGKAALLVYPFMDTQAHGVFAMRGPARPNPIGLSVLKLTKINGNVLFVRDVDIVDGTPLLDIKPYVPDFDIRPAKSCGWLDNNVKKLANVRDDGRFKKS